MSAHDTLTQTLRDILHVLNPTEDDRNRRLQVVDDLQDLIESSEISRGATVATVEPFGSFVSNLYTRWGDLDISIELPNGAHISSLGKKHKQSLLEEMQQALNIHGGFRRIRFSSHPKELILKCDHKELKISCHIYINNLGGLMKSKMLLWINMIDGHFREMVLLVKEWAKTHRINDPEARTFSSYSLALLVIFHFQTCEPAILPPLREIYPGSMVEYLHGVRADVVQRIEDVCLHNINRITSAESRRINQSSLAELFISFLEKFRDMESRASEQGISPYNGQWEDIETNMIWQPRTYALFIEDPFEQPLNCARGISGGKLGKIAQAFKSSLEHLTTAGENSRIDVLVRPQILSIMRERLKNS